MNVCHQCGSGTNATLTTIRNRNTTAEHRPGEVLEHPLDRAAEGEDQDDGDDERRWRSRPACAWSGAPGMRPIQAPNSVAAALPASAGQPELEEPEDGVERRPRTAARA